MDKNKFFEVFSWRDFFSYANTLSEKGKGDIFEYLTKLILITKPEYSSILKNVWIQQDDIPKDIREKINLPDSDEGIDIVAETFHGEFWAIQCKFKGQNQTPNYKELSTFGNLANNYCKHISLAILVHTGEKGVRKRKLLGENYTEIGLDFWLGLKEEDWARIHDYLKGRSIKPKPKVPRTHQQRAIDSALEHFLQNNRHRGRLIMPCGTGKSLTAFWIANALKANSVIVAVPSLSLIKQSLEDWTREFIAHEQEPRPEWLVICSDESTGKLDEGDKFVADVHSMGIPTTTDIEVISSFLVNNYHGKKIIFTTYQSSDKLAQAARKCKYSFDLAILDEAHKTVGVKSKAFATLLSDQNISISKRMFMTATERVMRGMIEEVYSMDNKSIYGDLFYQLSFKEAINSDPQIICDYKVLTITVTNQEIKSLIDKNKLVTDISKKIEGQEAQALAAVIALRKATQKYGIKHAISFHRSINGADEFSKLNTKLNEGRYDHVILRSSHISSKKSAGERARLLTDFANEQLALMTNARCLTEGVNVPAIDCVLFADPKQSKIDIVQAAGRALRPYPGKKFGYIMLPLIIPDNLSFDEFTECTSFREVAKVIAALSTQDEGIAEEFRTTNSGRRNGGKKIVLDGAIPVGMDIDLIRFSEKVNAKIWEKVAKVNWRTFIDAREFVHNLNLESKDDWFIYCKSGKKPEDIPSTPQYIYLDKGWESYGDWLGNGKVANQLKEYWSFEEARAFVHELKLKSGNEWIEYSKSGKKPENIPSVPQITYLNQGWRSMGDWLGTGTIASYNKVFRPFGEARAFVHRLNIKSGVEWRRYCKSGIKPEDIPAAPHRTYGGEGWKGMGDWLGTDAIAPQNKQYLKFEEARIFVHGLNLKNQRAWFEYCKSGKKPDNIPTAPHQTYNGKGWKGMGDWLGNDYIPMSQREYLQFEEARAFVHRLNLKSENEWIEYSKSWEKPKYIPSYPSRIYMGKGWKSMGDWLGTNYVASHIRKYQTFEKARMFVNELKLRNKNEWIAYSKSIKKPEDIPASPSRTYKDKGWKGWGDWLGTGTVASFLREYRTFDEARTFVHALKINSLNEWKHYCKSKNKPDDIPATPSQTYKDKGWKGWGDWLGTGTVAPSFMEFLPFDVARSYIQGLGLKNQVEWRNYIKSGKKPKEIPSSPPFIYKDKGWKGWGDWLGTGSIASQNRQYLQFEEARAFVQQLNLKDNYEWNEYCKSGNKPDNIPANPRQIFKDKGWLGMGDWLGTGAIASFLREYRSFEHARTFVHGLNLRSRNEWKEYCESEKKPNDIPYAPDQSYKGKGWTNWGDWLGTGIIANQLKQYLPFEKARKYVHNLELKKQIDWKRYCKYSKLPAGIPSRPDHVYQDQGWTSWGDWLGTGTIARQNMQYLKFEEARNFVHQLKLQNSKDWDKFCKSGIKPKNIPATPRQTYKDKGWAGMGDWLGKENESIASS